FPHFRVHRESKERAIDNRQRLQNAERLKGEPSDEEPRAKLGGAFDAERRFCRPRGRRECHPGGKTDNILVIEDFFSNLSVFIKNNGARAVQIRGLAIPLQNLIDMVDTDTEHVTQEVRESRIRESRSCAWSLIEICGSNISLEFCLL